MLLFALRTCVAHWASEKLHLVDERLEQKNVTLLDLPWKEYACLPDDNDHFTWDGYTRFAKDLASKLLQLPGRILLLSDSTIDYWNYDESNIFTGWADIYLHKCLGHDSYRVTVDAVRGSGFYAMYDTGRDFRTRMRHHHTFDSTVFVGGWNDVTFHDMREVMHAIDRTLRPIRVTERIRAV